jgi:hypothetical protein
MVTKRWVVLWVTVLSVGAFARGQEGGKDSVKINQIQVIGSHNSYHAGLAPSEARLMMEKNPKIYRELEYRHQPLDQQLNAGIRQIELDIFADSQGGRYAHPAGINAVAAAGLPKDPDFDPDGVMSKPGFKVMHIQDYDYRSTCQPLVACLKIVRAWSLSHPGHVPVLHFARNQNRLAA